MGKAQRMPRTKAVSCTADASTCQDTPEGHEALLGCPHRRKGEQTGGLGRRGGRAPDSVRALDAEAVRSEGWEQGREHLLARPGRRPRRSTAGIRTLGAGPCMPGAPPATSPAPPARLRQHPKQTLCVSRGWKGSKGYISGLEQWFLHHGRETHRTGGGVLYEL